MKDKYGNEVQIGDIVLSASSSGTVVIGPVTKVHSAGNVTMEYEYTRNIYAHEHGAPSTFYTATRWKRDENGEYVKEDRGRKDWRNQPVLDYVSEEYQAESKDYTVVGKRKVRAKRVSAFTVVILRKFDGSEPLKDELDKW